MALPGLLIEYLVVGSMALLWLLPLVGINYEGEIPFGRAAALAPAIYVVGMFVDFIAFVLVSRFPRRKYSLKALARWIVRRKPDIQNIENIRNNVFRDGYGRSSRGTIWLYLHAPEIIKEVQARSSRDRVARGAFVNILIMWVISIASPNSSLPIFSCVSVYEWVLIVIFSLCVWLFLEANSYGFELRAGDMVPENEELSR